MEGILIKQIMSVVVPWTFALIVGVLLLRQNRENKNPLEWSTVDRCLLLIALFCFIGGAANLVIGISVFMYFKSLPWANWTIIHLYYQVNRIIGLPWIFLLLIGLWLRKRFPDSGAFAHIVIQLNAIHISFVSYTFGPVTHPGAFLLSMAIGIFNFLLFETSLALPWMATVTVLLVVSTIATWIGWIPYAPIYTSSPFQGGDIDIFYLMGTMAIVMTIFLLMLLLMAYIFARWRDREKKVAEMPLRIYEVGGIAGSYNLTLDVKDPALVSLLRTIPLRYTVLGGKHIGKEGINGLMVRLSKKSAEIQLKESIKLLSNLKMNLVDVDEELSTKDFYGKVVESVRENGRTKKIRFTSIPPEIAAYFHSHQQHAVMSKKRS